MSLIKMSFSKSSRKAYSAMTMFHLLVQKMARDQTFLALKTTMEMIKDHHQAQAKGESEKMEVMVIQDRQSRKPDLAF